MQAKRDAKAQKLHQALLTIPIGDRIRVKFSTGVYECTLLQVNPADETVLVAWSEGGTKIFNWNKIIFGGWKADPAQRTTFSALPAGGPSTSSGMSLVLVPSSSTNRRGLFGLPAAPPLALPYLMIPGSKPRTSNDFHVTAQTDSRDIQVPHQVTTVATTSHADHSSTLLRSDPSHHRHHVYPAHQADFESQVDIPAQLQVAKQSRADLFTHLLVKETTPALPALSPDASSNDISMTD